MSYQLPVYLDYAASTPLDPRVEKAMRPYQTAFFGNASSVHRFGREAMAGVDAARVQLGQLLGCKPTELIFTSGATEANNLALLGALAPGDHLITSEIEHPSVLEPAREFARRGGAVSYVRPQADGVVALDDVIAALTPTTRLVSLMYLNNELGTSQPVAELGRALQQVNEERKRAGNRPVLLHTDAVQAARELSVNVHELGVDLLSLSAHKIYGPKGVGLLWVRSGIKLKPLFFGGAQQSSIRPGTFATPLIVGFGKAAALLQGLTHEHETQAVIRLRRQLVTDLQALPGISINANQTSQRSGMISLRCDGVDAQSLLILLDGAGFAVSAGAACSSGSLEPSHVLGAIGLSQQQAQATLRVSLGRFSTAAEVKAFCLTLKDAYAQLRRNVKGRSRRTRGRGLSRAGSRRVASEKGTRPAR